jgi:LuxR family maltose regulon positive regulatory protein
MNVERLEAPGRPEAPLLLLTKLHAPAVLAQAVVRSRLHGQLGERRGRRLTLVACPAGFGQSTLLAAWPETQVAERYTAWLTIDEGDDDAVVLWSHVVEALERACPAVREADLCRRSRPQRCSRSSFPGWSTR